MRAEIGKLKIVNLYTLQVYFLTRQKPAYQFRRVSQKLKLKYWEYGSQVVSQRVAEKCAILLIICFQKGLS